MPDSNVRVRSFESDEWSSYRTLRLCALEESPDAFGSTLARESGHSDEHWRERLRAGVESDSDLPLVAIVDGRPAGVAWGRADENDSTIAHLYQMWVAPEARGRGAGTMLLDDVIGWSTLGRYQTLELGVTCADTPAWRLYTRAGFLVVSEPSPIRAGSDVLGVRMQLTLRPPAA